MLPPDVAAAVDAARARSRVVPLDVRWYRSVGSTMDVAGEAAQAGAPEGLVIVADEQTAGRGRRGRPWISPPGAGIYLSLVLRPQLDAMSSRLLSLITLAAGVAVRSAITRASGFSAELKWPNDVMAGRRKLAGVLAEGLAIATPAQSVVLGLGVNILTVAHIGEIAERATSIEAELGRAVERERILEELLVAVPIAYDGLRRGETDDILRQWREGAPSAHGAIVEWEGGARRYSGTTAGIDDDGALLIRTTEGVKRVISGELRWL